VIEQKTKIGTIDITPTWESLIPVLVPLAAEGNVTAMNELRKLARIVDTHIANLKALRDEAPKAPVCPDCGVRGAHAFGCPLGVTTDG